MQAFPSHLIQGFSIPVTCVNVKPFAYIRRRVGSTGRRELETQKKIENKSWVKDWAGEETDNGYEESVSKQHKRGCEPEE